MTRIRYMMPARSQGTLYMQGGVACLTEKDVRDDWVFACHMAPDVETLVRKWLSQRLDGFYCDLQAMYTPNHVSSTRTRIVLNNTPPLHTMRGLTTTDAVKALVKATGLSPRLSVCGGPFCLDDVDDVNDAEGV